MRPVAGSCACGGAMHGQCMRARSTPLCLASIAVLVALLHCTRCVASNVAPDGARHRAAGCRSSPLERGSALLQRRHARLLGCPALLQALVHLARLARHHDVLHLRGGSGGWQGGRVLGTSRHRRRQAPLGAARRAGAPAGCNVHAQACMHPLPLPPAACCPPQHLLLVHLQLLLARHAPLLGRWQLRRLLLIQLLAACCPRLLQQQIKVARGGRPQHQPCWHWRGTSAARRDAWRAGSSCTSSCTSSRHTDWPVFSHMPCMLGRPSVAPTGSPCIAPHSHHPTNPFTCPLTLSSLESSAA